MIRSIRSIAASSPSPISSSSLSSSSSSILSSTSSILSHHQQHCRHFASVRRRHPSMTAFRDFLASKNSLESQKFPNLILPSKAESTQKILSSKQTLPKSFLESDGTRKELKTTNEPLPLTGPQQFLIPPPLFVSKAIKSVSRAAHLMIQISPQKLNDMCRRVRGLNVDESLIQLRFAQKRKAVFIANLIRHAAMNGVKNYQMDRSRLFIHQLYVGKGQYYKRVDIRARGKHGMKRVYNSNLFVELMEQPSNPNEIIDFQRSSPYKNGIEIRIGRYGRRPQTIENTKELLKEYTLAKKELGLKEHESIPINRRIAEINDYTESMNLAIQLSLQNAAGSVPATGGGDKSS